MVSQDIAEHRRDCRLRKWILQALHATRVRPQSGWTNGRFLFDLLEGGLPGGQQFESDLHLLGLLRDLVNARYVEERDDRIRENDLFSIDSLSFRVTASGSALSLEAIEPDPLVDDSRTRRRKNK